MSLDNSYGGKVTKLNDAILHGDFETPEVLGLLGRRFDVLVGLKAKQRTGTWRKWSPTLEELILTKFVDHPATPEKDGHAIVFASGIENGQYVTLDDGGAQLPLSGRTLKDVEAVTFAGFDIDDGDALELAIERLKKLGYFAILYTTYSHGKLRSEHSADRVNKYRILIPLEEPFELNPSDPEAHRHNCWEWRERLESFAAYVLDLVIDESGCDATRMFYTPRHAPGDENWFLGIFAGRALPVEEMPLPMTTVRPRFRRGRRSSADLHKLVNRARPILSDGFDLIDWHRDWATEFQVREFFDWLQWEMGRTDDRRSQARILCPNDDAHSSYGDEMGCWIKDGDSATPFVVFCHHNACRELGTLELLVELERVVLLPDGYETLSELLCEPLFYSSYVNESDGFWPAVGHYCRWDPQDIDEEIGQ